MATLHLLHGFIGSGKTTLARRLERELPALRVTFEPLGEDEPRSGG